MRTETRTYTLYRITELSEEAKEKAHTEWLYNRYFYGWTHENRQTLNTFCERFGIVCRNWRYDACNYSYDYRSRQEDCIDRLNGWRLAAYLMNNHWNDLYTPKYFWKGTKGRKSRIFGRTRQTLWRAVQMLTQKLCCQTIHDCPKVVPLHYESEWQ